MDRKIFQQTTIHHHIESLFLFWTIKSFARAVNKDRLKIERYAYRNSYSILDHHFWIRFIRKDNGFLFIKRCSRYIQVFETFLMKLFERNVFIPCFFFYYFFQPFLKFLSFVPAKMFIQPVDPPNKEKTSVIEFFKICF